MKAERHSVRYGEYRIDFSIVRRDRTTLEIAVEPDASVVVAAPQDAQLAAIEEKVRKRIFEMVKAVGAASKAHKLANVKKR